MAGKIRKCLLYLVLPPILAACAALAWLRWDAYRPQAAYFDARQGRLVDIQTLESYSTNGQSSSFLRLVSDSGLAVSVRVIRRSGDDRALPVLVVLGGHRTGSDAVDLFGNVGDRAVVALDYPYDGPEKVKGVRQVLATLPLARRAFLDTPPAVSLTLDWLSAQPWADQDQVVIIGASLGVPFAALAAARDDRIDGAMLVHGAADNQRWLETQVARRNANRLLVRPLATLIHWLAYAPTFDTARNVGLISPRPVLVIGATDDERTPAGETEALYEAAGEPRRLRWTRGQHIEPDRHEIIAELLEIADEELPLGHENR